MGKMKNALMDVEQVLVDSGQFTTTQAHAVCFEGKIEPNVAKLLVVIMGLLQCAPAPAPAVFRSNRSLNRTTQ